MTKRELEMAVLAKFSFLFPFDRDEQADLKGRHKPMLPTRVSNRRAEFASSYPIAGPTI